MHLIEAIPTLCYLFIRMSSLSWSAVNDSSQLKNQILAILRTDGRASVSAMSLKLGVDRRLVTRVLDDAIHDGNVRIAASIHPEVMGWHRFAYLQVESDGPLQPVKAALVEMHETTWVSETTGEFAVDAEVRVPSDSHLRATIGWIQLIPGVRSVRSHLFESNEINVYSPNAGGTPGIEVDDIDRQIIKCLQRDGRESFRQISDAVGLTPSGIRARYNNLVQAGAIKVVGVPVRSGQPGPPPLGLGIRVHGSLDAAKNAVKIADPEFLAVTFGEYDLIATLSSRTHRDLLSRVDVVRCSEHVAHLTTWSHLEIVKEEYGRLTS